MRFPLSFLKAALALGSLGGAQASLKHASSADFEKLADLTRPANLKHHAHGHQHPSHSDESEVGQGIDWMAEPASYAGPMRIVGMGEVPAADDQHGAGKQKQIQKAMNEMEKGAKKTAKNGAQSSNSGGSSFSPTNPPSIPLAVRSPYLNAWLPSGSLPSATPPNVVGNGGYLAGQYPSFWTSSYGADGEYRLGWTGYIRIDGTTYQWMGNSFGTIVRAGENANQLSAEHTATRTIFAFEAAGVNFNVTFLTPVTPDDYLRQSIPLSYMHVELDDATSAGRDVQLYTDIDERWVTGHDYDYQNYPYQFTFNEHNGTQQYFIQRTSPQIYTEYRQRAEWGNVSYAALSRPGLSSRNNNNVVAQKEFLDTGGLTLDHNPTAGPMNSYAFAVDFSAKNGSSDALFVIGHLRSPYVNYIRAVPGSNGTKSYQQDRYGYWQSKFPKFADAVSFFLHDFKYAQKAAVAFDNKIREESRAVVGGGEVGDHYAAITQLSVRQAFATFEITVPYNKTTRKYDTNDTLLFLKEISSNGDMSTVDVIFPLFPLLSYTNPDLLRDLMLPIFEYTESGLYPNKWCVHDLGVYPNAFGHNDGNDEPMQVEESGNMILMTLHWAQLVGKEKAIPFLKTHYRIMKQWAEFLIEDSLIPATQLSTDDFAGTLANQTDLAIKGIEGISAMGYIATLIGQTSDARNYENVSQSYITLWQKYAVDSTRTHTKLAYQDDESWGTLYNLFGDRLLNLRLVPKSIYDLQDNWYPTVAQKWGVPLDSRHNWTKSDWEMFAAGTSALNSTRDLFINKLYDFMSNGRTDAPFTDLYESTTGDFPKQPFDPLIHFLARPVVGGHFMLLAMAAADKANGISAENPYQYGPEPGHKQSSPAASSAASKSSSSAEDGDAPSGKDEDEKVTQKKENENKNENKNRNGRYEMKKRPKDATVKHVQQYAFAVPLDE